MNKDYTQHIPVLSDEVLKFLQPTKGGSYIDGTIGGGGHTASILEKVGAGGRVLGIDTDEQALTRVRARLGSAIADGELVLAHGNFSDLAHIAQENGFASVQGVLLDLGFSSDQMDTPERGFSFSADGPLDMRLDQTLPTSAADLVNQSSEQELADIIWRYGEETRSRAIARRIVRSRTQHPIVRTAQLATIVATGIPFRSGMIHPATKTFQALRIAVNQELERLESVLPQIVDLLSTGETSTAGRMALISFHSLEDRAVKTFMRQEASDCICPPHLPVCVCQHRARLRILTSKPIMASAQEVERNPRARSAKLRVAERMSDS